jgi:hypothetical protein
VIHDFPAPLLPYIWHGKLLSTGFSDSLLPIVATIPSLHKNLGWLVVLAQPPEVLCHRLLISLRDAKRVSVADLARVLLVQIPSQAELEVIHGSQNLPTKLLDQRRIASVIAGAEPFKIAHQILNVSESLRFTLDVSAQSIEFLQGLLPSQFC